jgi:signal transduction histidine kinase
MTGPLEDLAAGREPPGGRQAAIQAMHRNANWLLRLINQLLDLSRVDAGVVRLNKTGVNLAALCRSLTSRFLPDAKSKGVSLVLEAPAQMKPTALDPVWMESMLSNLVGNALRFVGKGGKIKVRVIDGDDTLTLQVEDDGPGISSEELPHIFERFAQAGGYRARRGGAGIGLALVREGARLHGGDAIVESEPGRGTLFTITLPREEATGKESSGDPASVERDRPLSRAHQELLPDPAGAEADANREGPSPDAPLVLVVEDHADTRRFVADVLAAEYRVRSAADGKEALVIVKNTPPDAVVTDIDMPEVDGLALCKALRDDDETRSIPVLLLTALGDPTSVLRGFDAGADDYIPKPFHGRELLARLSVQLRLRQMVSHVSHKARLAMLGVTAASVAHQMRNPLNAISSGLQSFQKRFTDIDPATREMLEMMLESSLAIEGITNDLMNVSRVDREPVDKWRAAEALQSCARLIKARLPQRVTLDSQIDTDAVIEGRPGDLNQVFLNLLDNALQAVGEQGRIELKAQREEQTLVITVADSGPGIPESLHDRIFHPFFTSREAGRGTGLGLSIARQVTERHGGKITVGNSALGGSLFRVELPFVGSSAAGDGMILPGTKLRAGEDTGIPT